MERLTARSPIARSGPVTSSLLRWGSGRLRDLPWRRTRDPWMVLVSEVMLQQTSVARVLPKYTPFVERFPTPLELVAAPLGEALVLWEGLGYPRRCRNLRAAAHDIVALHGGRVPDDLEQLLALPGVGAYTARAVLAFAHERDVAVVDTNVGRFLARLGGRPLTSREAQSLAEDLVPRDHGWEWNQIAMDFGSAICRARTPRCEECPLVRCCAWHGGRDGGPDPALMSAATSRPQTRFEGSDRQARGRAMRAVAERSMDRADLHSAMGLEHDRERADRLISVLVAEGLLLERADVVSLP